MASTHLDVVEEEPEELVMLHPSQEEVELFATPAAATPSGTPAAGAPAAAALAAGAPAAAAPASGGEKEEEEERRRGGGGEEDEPPGLVPAQKVRSKRRKETRDAAEVQVAAVERQVARGQRGSREVAGLHGLSIHPSLEPDRFGGRRTTRSRSQCPWTAPCPPRRRQPRRRRCRWGLGSPAAARPSSTPPGTS